MQCAEHFLGKSKVQITGLIDYSGNISSVVTEGTRFSDLQLCWLEVCQCKGKGKGTMAVMHIRKSTPWLVTVTVTAAGSTAAAGGCHPPIWALHAASHPVHVEHSPGRMGYRPAGQ